MAREHGKSGSINWTAGYSSHCFNWSCNYDEDQTPGETFGAVHGVNDGGLRRGSGSFQCYVDGTTPLTGVGVTGTLVMKRNSGGRQITAKIRISGRAENVGLGGNQIVTYNWTLSGDGSASDFVDA